MIEEWTTVVKDSARQVATDMGFSEFTLAGEVDELPKGLMGPIVPLVGVETSVQIAILAKAEDQEQLARVILLMEPDEEMARDEALDAVGEFANCLVGQMKRSMLKYDSSLRIGLPMFIEGNIVDNGRAERRVVQTTLNGYSVSMVLVVA